MEGESSAGPLQPSAATGPPGMRSFGVLEFLTDSLHDWSDGTVLAAACDVLKSSGGYPADNDRRALYKQWLHIYASEEWNDSFDELTLMCLAFTPSPTSPTEPLFGDCFKLAADGSWDPVLNTVHVGEVFTRRRLDENDVHESPLFYHFTGFLAKLLLNEESDALNEAGMLIGFCCLLICAASVQNLEGAQAVFTKWSMPAPSSIFRTSLSGRIPCPRTEFLVGLLEKTASRRCVLLPYAVVLPVAQYVLLKKAGGDAPEGDLAFLEAAFLGQTRYAGLETLDVLRQLADDTGLGMGSLNTLLGGNECKLTRQRVEKYLRTSTGPGEVVQHSMPWCRMICPLLFWDLEVRHNIAYTLRILCFLLPEPSSSLENLRELTDFEGITQDEVARAHQWANNFAVLLSRGLFRPEKDRGTDGTSGP